MSVYKYKELENAPLIIDAIYESRGTLFGDGSLDKLLPNISNQGGFRVAKRRDNSNQVAYIALYTSFEELEWPDSLDIETGVLKYFGDNRTPGKSLHDTPKNGNKYLRDIFSLIDQADKREDIPPFLVFQKTGRLFDVKFLGIAAPSNPNIPPDRELNALWRTKDGSRFQNYEAYFTILDTGCETINKEWLNQLITDHDSSLNIAPTAWKTFIKDGRLGIKPLVTTKKSDIPRRDQQLPTLDVDKQILQTIRNYYQKNPYEFEQCATRIVQMMDSNFERFELTRPWRDGGRDAIGIYRVGINNIPLVLDCALEAKCYSESTSVGVKPMSRLISRIKYRQFGVLVTTSYVDSQAYKEIIEDGHPILVICAKDIANILRNHGIGKKETITWLQSIGYDFNDNKSHKVA